MDCSPPGFSVHGKNTGAGCHFLLQGTFSTQWLNLCLLLGRWILYHWATWEALSAKYLHSNMCPPERRSRRGLASCRGSGEPPGRLCHCWIPDWNLVFCEIWKGTSAWTAPLGFPSSTFKHSRSQPVLSSGLLKHRPNRRAAITSEAFPFFKDLKVSIF